MNIQSIILLLLLLGAFVATVRIVVRKNRRNPGCGSCSCCDDSRCSLRRR